jgi:hypothetical protein
MLIAYAGRLPGSADFPIENVEHVKEQLDRLMSNLRPEAVVGSAAAGADLLVLDAALQSGATATVFLAGNTDQFREGSVSGRGSMWEQSYEQVCRHPRVELVEVPLADTAVASYAAVTRQIVEVAERAAANDEVVGVNVSRARDGRDHSAELASGLALRGHLVLTVDTVRARGDTSSAFVAMPYGKRPDGYEADATYRRIIVPALIDAGLSPFRADAEAALEMIDLTMLRAINTAQVLIADLATLNANVMWELGVRHAWRRAGTVLIRPAGTPAPFDVSHARVHEYRRAKGRVSDADAVAGIRQLRGLLAAIEEDRIDSPVFAALPDLSEQPALPDLPPDAATKASSSYLESISLAAELGETDKLRDLAEDVRVDLQLSAGFRQSLLEQIGIGFVATGDHRAAAEMLAPLAEKDVAMERIGLQQQYAHALIRSSAPEEGAERLEQAAARLRALIRRYPGNGESYGLLGSAAKARVERAVAAHEPPGRELAIAIDAYRAGFRADPTDYYPGVVAVALLRLRGQYLEPNDDDVRAARDLIPVVRFATERLETDTDVWLVATRAELVLHEYFLNVRDDELLDRAKGLYATAKLTARPDQRGSILRQLRLLEDAGDPRDAIEPIRALYEGP